MLFSHDTRRALECLVDLVNTRPSLTTAEQLGDLDAVAEFVEAHDISGVGRLSDSDVEELQALRALMTPVFDADDDLAAAAAVNRIVAEAAVTPRLTDHDGYDWHVHYFAPGATLAEHLRLDCGMALAHVIAAGERTRLDRCAAPGCARVLVDLSRNRSKRYCDARTCGNRLHVAAYRERQRSAAS